MALRTFRSSATAQFFRSTILQSVRFCHHNKETRQPLMSYAHGASYVPLLNHTIGQRLRMAADNVPDKEVFIFRQSGIRKTFAEFLKDSEKLATGLISLGLEKGDRVGMWGPNSYEWVVCQFATALAGFVMVNINPAYQSTEVKFALQKVGVKALISAPSFKKSNYYRALVSVVPEIASGSEDCGAVRSHELPEFKHLIMLGEQSHRGAWKYDDILDAGGSDAKATLNIRETDTQPDDAVNVQFTSGTTGLPKGAVLTHHNIVNNAYFVGRRAMYHHGKDILCVPNPLYHCMGCVTGSLSVVVHQNTCVFPAPSFESLAALKAVNDEKCTVLFGTPTMFIDMLNHPQFSEFDYSSLRQGFMAGAPCPIELCRRLVNDMNMRDIQIAYGTTETSPVSFMAILDDPPEKRVRSVGHILDHVEASIVDGQGRTLPRGQRGELLVRGYLVMQGYWNDREKTNADITPDRWYHAGDVALMNEDGSVQIVGRTKDMIVRGGENIYPTEIEQFLFQHPLIEDVHIIGVPDERFGEEVCAWIRLHESAEPSQVTTETLKEFCTGKIAHYKVPRYVLIKKEHDFPLTVTGKVKKYELREISKVELGLDQVKSHFNE